MTPTINKAMVNDSPSSPSQSGSSPKKSPPVWFTIKEAAEYLGVKEPTIYRWMREGLITYRKVGDSTRFWQEDLDAVMRVYPTPEDASKVQEFCPVCHHNELVSGRVQSSGLNHFYPEKTKFWTFRSSNIPTLARMCARCGAITWFGDTARLNALRKENPSDHSENSTPSTE